MRLFFRSSDSGEDFTAFRSRRPSTAWQVTAKTAAGFTVNFATPAPAGGGTFDWGLLNQIVTSVGLGTVTLADYLTTLRRLLHDPNDDIWSSADKTAYLNEALQRRDGRLDLFFVNSGALPGTSPANRALPALYHNEGGTASHPAS